MLSVKGNTGVEDNTYQISSIAFEKKSTDYYAHFHFNNKKLAEDFYCYLRITMAGLISSEDKPQKIGFLLVNSLSDVDCIVSLKGNIHQAIKVLIEDNTIEGQLKFTLLDSEEENLQNFLKGSKNCNHTASLNNLSATEKPSSSNIPNKKPPVHGGINISSPTSQLRSY